MNIKPIILILLIVSVSLYSCTKSPIENGDGGTTTDSANVKANKWISQQLERYYFWPDKIRTGISKELNPSTYFYNTIWESDSEAGFSYIEPTTGTKASTNGYVTGFGMEVLRWTYEGTTINTLQVLYVTPGSPADKAGIKRGDIFSKYNGIQITSTNHNTLFSLPSVRLTRSKGDASLTKIDEVVLTQGSYYDTHVIRDTVYQLGGSKSIGYLYYSSFTPANGAISDPDLKEAISRMKEKQITELILDIRFNGGGYLNVCTELATMLLPWQYNISDVFLYEESRSGSTAPIRFSSAVSSYRINTLERLHVMVNGNSASAGEIMIHGLRQYMDVILYGEQTVGKNVGSQEFSGTGGGIPWKIHPITVRIYDKWGKAENRWETFVGFTPDYYFDEVSDGLYYYQGKLGEYDPAKDCDPMLNYVMAQMGYTTPLNRTVRRSAGSSRQAVYTPNEPQMLIMK